MNFVRAKKKKIKRFPLSNEDLHRLSSVDSGIVLREDCRCHLKLNYSALPLLSSQFKEAIYDELNERTLTYNSELNDMILRYTNIRLCMPVEANRSRKLNVTCMADIYVFKPERDSVLTATVNKISKNHIGGVIYDVFNVSIVRPPKIPYNKWAGRDFHINNSVTFKVVKVDVSEVIPYIIGDLICKEDDQRLKENDERDNVIGTDQTRLITSEKQFSDLDDVKETLEEPKSRKRKLTDKGDNNKVPRKRKRMK